MKIKTAPKFILSSLLAVCLAAQGLFGAAAGGYSEYKLNGSSASAADEVISINGAEFVAVTGDAAAENGALKSDGSGTANYEFSVPSDARYNIYLTYAALDKNKSSVDIGIKLDGEYPFEEASKLTFPTAWCNEVSEFAVDTNGNQLTPKQVMISDYYSRLAKDNTGVEVMPYEIFLSAGRHTLSVVGCGDGFSIKSIKLVPPEEDISYSEYIKQYSNKSSKPVEAIVLEGEAATKKTSFAIIPKSDTLDASVSPSSPKNTMLNYIGGTSWQSAGEAVSWGVEVKQSGLYKLTFHYKQVENINRSSYRHLTVDGRTPFAEAREVEFEYASKWKYKELGDGDEPYLIWLEAGYHNLTLEVTLGEKTAGYYTQLDEITQELNRTYLNIIKITGPSPDTSRDYDLFNQIPDLQESLESNYKKLNALTAEVESDDGGKTSEMAAAFKNMSRVLKNMIDKPYNAHEYVSTYFSNYSTLSTWLQDMKEMPLSLDCMVVSTPDDAVINKVSFIEKLKYRIIRFLTSFTTDYDNISGADGENTITVWSTLGRDQASALDVMIKQDFTEKTGINVNLKIVSASLINGLMSNEYPDVMLGLSRTDPVNYGIRSALYDLKKFDDYDEVIARFQKGADIPYTYNGSAYALPETQSFYIMFYRTDILERLGLEVPKTWDEFIEASVTIQRNNMEVYIPYTSIASAGTVNLGIGSIGLFPTFMLQNGLPLYNEEHTATAINTPEAISVFEYWTKMYTDYKMQKTLDFYNRFRMGICPIGIAGYGTYFSLVQMAPEIQGKYSMALVPSMTSTGSNAVAGGGSGCAIINRSDKPDKAWEFLKWYTSAEVQSEYSKRVESILGLVGRITTANVEALNNMEWDKEQLSILNEQWKAVEEIPEIPGSYYLIRSVDQAYWSVVNSGANAKDAIAEWNASADAEIERKHREYGEN